MIILVPNFTPLRDKLWHSDAGQNILDLLAQLRSVLKFLCISLTGINPGLKCWPEMICKVVQPLTKVLVLLFTCKSLRRFFCFRSSNLGSYNLPKLWSQHHYWSKARPHWTRYKCMSCAFVHGLSINLIFLCNPWQTEVISMPLNGFFLHLFFRHTCPLLIFLAAAGFIRGGTV